MGGCSSSHDSTLTTRCLQNLDQAREGWGNHPYHTALFPRGAVNHIIQGI